MVTAWLDWWPLLVTCVFALTASLWTFWALGDALYAGLLSIPASCGFGGLISMITERRR